jgi:putative phosphonate metabolism protein
MPADARVALYYAPLPDDPLFAASTAWLGRDPSGGASARHPDLPGIAEVTAEPRQYGFHATLKPPFRPAAGVAWSSIVSATRILANSIAPFDLPPLAMTDLHGFLALTETEPCPALQALADSCVADMDVYRAPASEDEQARRRRSPLTPAQDAMLVRWGYPYVFDTWFFHMTLTRRLSPEEKQFWQPAAEQFLASAVAAPRRATDICLFTQPGPRAPFVIAERIPLRG